MSSQRDPTLVFKCKQEGAKTLKTKLMSFKKCKVVMLPTNEKAHFGDLFLNEYNHLKVFNRPFAIFNKEYIYITSDEEIKVGDWIYGNAFNNEIKQVLSKDDEIWFKNNKHCWNKVIATTDKLRIPSVSLGWDNPKDYLPQPSRQFIEKFIEEYNKGNVITDVLVEYIDNGEEGWRGSNEDGEPIWNEKIELKVNPKDNTITIKKVKDSWNREEVIILMNKSIDRGIELKTNYKVIYKQSLIDNWIKNNL